MCEGVPLTDMREKREDKKSLSSAALRNRSAELIAPAWTEVKKQ
jgi:hypothetical protein